MIDKCLSLDESVEKSFVNNYRILIFAYARVDMEATTTLWNRIRVRLL
jgi:hypothetical protein